MEKTWLNRAVDFLERMGDPDCCQREPGRARPRDELMILAETRRRSVWPGLMFVLWLVYQILDIAGSYALGHLSLDTTADTDAAKHEQVLIAL